MHAEGDGEAGQDERRQQAGLRRIEEETEYYEEEEEESDCEPEMLMKPAGDSLLFPVLAPPEQFQNCISPSAIYEMSTMTLQTYGSKATHQQSVVEKRAASRNNVASPAYSQDSSITSSSATEKSVRFSDRDHILSTPEPSPHHYADEGSWRRHGDTEKEVKGILKCPDVTSFLLDSEDGTLV